eukprot:1696437-Pleurochrysis_carterae.AAC.1
MSNPNTEITATISQSPGTPEQVAETRAVTRIIDSKAFGISWKILVGVFSGIGLLIAIVVIVIFMRKRAAARAAALNASPGY